MVDTSNASGQFGPSQFTVSTVIGEAAFNSIASAVIDASSVGGGTIVLAPGTYTENVTWPANVDVIGSAVGLESFRVVINGNQTFAATGNISFADIEFTSVAGDTFALSSTGNSVSEFSNCSFKSTVGNCINLSTTSVFSARFDKCIIAAIGNSAINAASGSVIISVDNCVITTSTDNQNTISLMGSPLLNISESTISNSLGATSTGSCISLQGATGVVGSNNNQYSFSQGAGSSAFEYTIAGGQITSTKDRFNSTGATYWANSTGAFGNLSYTNAIILGGSSLIDPQITSIELTNLPISSAVLTWTDYAISTTVSANTGSVSTAAITLILPATPANGDLCAFAVNFAGAFTIMANAGHSIRMGNVLSVVAGTVQSSAVGSVVRLIYNSASSLWFAESVVGNWVIS